MSQVDRNYMNCTSNCFHTHSILQIWPPVTTGCLQISKECSWERDLAPMKKLYQKLKHILRLKINRSTKKGLNCLRSIGISVSPLKETILINKIGFCLKVVVLLVRPGTYWVMCYRNKLLVKMLDILEWGDTLNGKKKQKNKQKKTRIYQEYSIYWRLNTLL